MTFHINSQQADVINMAGRDQYIGVTPSTDPDLLVRQIRQIIDGLGLSPDLAVDASVQLDQASKELAKADPDKPTVADRLGKLVRILESAGALAAAGTSLVVPLTGLAAWLGSMGEPLLRSLNL